MIQWRSFVDQWVFVLEALAVSQGRTKGKDVPGWCRRWVISSEDIVERRQEAGASSESVVGTSSMSEASGVGDECGCGVRDDEKVKQ
jgi:hypothetical protein